MMNQSVRSFLRQGLTKLLPCLMVLTGCEPENLPDNPAPEIVLNEAQDITRNSARLSGSVTLLSEQSYTDRCLFRYGTTRESLERTEEPTPAEEQDQVSSTLEGLKPGTTYYFCLEAGNERYRRQSVVRSFTTLPNDPPRIGSITFWGQGPISILLQCSLTDDGGDPVTAVGFRYTAKGGEPQEAKAELTEDRQWQLRLSPLEMNRDYTVEAFAENCNGRTYSEPYAFKTSDAVMLVKPGTLPAVIGEEDIDRFTELSILSPMNGTDFRFLRKMCGKDHLGKPTRGKLQRINLTNSEIVEGGLAYDESHFTERHVVGQGMFANLPQLQEINLPEKTRLIGQDAFRNCSSLTRISIPAATEQLIPSRGCSSLQRVDITPGNKQYQSVDGVVYNGSGEALVWWPEGLKRETITFSPTLKAIEERALQQCRVRHIVLPNSLERIGNLAFYGSEMESVKLPDHLETLAPGVFQSCKNLKEMTLGSNCKLLSEFCLDGCELQHLYVNAEIPPACEPKAFGDESNLFATCIVHVPAQRLTAYRSHAFWKQFQFIQEK